MLTLYLDYKLDASEQVDVQLAVGEGIELQRIPWLFPLPPSGRPGAPIDPARVIPLLQASGLPADSGERVLLVAPRAPEWYACLAEAIERLTGLYPLLVQPACRRDELGCPGPLRVIDMEAYVRDEDSSTLPPWLVGDELL